MNLHSRGPLLELLLLKAVFSNKIVDMWNKLPLSVHQASNISSFKKSARDFLLSRYD